MWSNSALLLPYNITETLVRIISTRVISCAVLRHAKYVAVERAPFLQVFSGLMSTKERWW